MVWNFTELQDLINAKCNNTYKVLDEYMASGGFDIFADLSLPW